MGKSKHPRGLRNRDGKWHYRFKLNGQEYSGSTELAATTQNVNDALAARAEERKRILSGAPAKPEAKPFNRAAHEFLNWNDGEHRDHPNTAKRTRTSFASLQRFFRREPLLNITAGKIDKYKQWRRERHIEEVTIRHDLHNLSLLFQYGKKQGWCGDNPVEEVEIPSDEDAVRMYILTPAEERRYFAAALSVSQDLHDVGRIMILQGCRPEEGMSLEQANCNLRRRSFRIAKGKSKAAKRQLRMVTETRDILTRRLNKRGQWVFPSPRKKGRHIVKLINAHNRACELAGLEIVMYDLRHTFATRMAERGCPITKLAKILGHGSLRSVMKYIHHDQGSIDDAMDEYGEPLKNRPSAHKSEGLTRSDIDIPKDHQAKGDGPSPFCPPSTAIGDKNRLSRTTLRSKNA